EQRQSNQLERNEEMLSKRTPYLLAASALALGAGAGAGSYAAFGGQSGKTTTIVQQAAAQGSPAAATKTMSVNGVYQADRNGVVGALNRDISSTNNFTISGVIQTDAAINHGNSGGPLLNMAGEVVGITTQIESESGGNDGVGFAVPSSTISQVVSKLVKGQKVAHPYLGVYVQTSTNRSGAQIASVKSGSPAAAAGLKGGDVVTAFDGGTITSPDDLTAAVAAKRPGDKVSVTYLRSGSTKTTQVTIGTRPS